MLFGYIDHVRTKLYMKYFSYGKKITVKLRQLQSNLDMACLFNLLKPSGNFTYHQV
jgi:hypothetical protein